MTSKWGSHTTRHNRKKETRCAMPRKGRVSLAVAARRKGVQAMKRMVMRLTPEVREELKNALEKNASEITISYEEELELSDAQLGQVQGGANMVEYVILVGVVALLAAK